MNIWEFIIAPDLLLWGKLNSVFALLFIALIYFNEFIQQFPGSRFFSQHVEKTVVSKRAGETDRII